MPLGLVVGILLVTLIVAGICSLVILYLLAANKLWSKLSTMRGYKYMEFRLKPSSLLVVFVVVLIYFAAIIFNNTKFISTYNLAEVLSVPLVVIVGYLTFKDNKDRWGK